MFPDTTNCSSAKQGVGTMLSCSALIKQLPLSCVYSWGVVKCRCVTFPAAGYLQSDRL